jgi:hypothetical protein
MALKDIPPTSKLDRYADIMLQGSSLDRFVPLGLDPEDYEALMEKFNKLFKKQSHFVVMIFGSSLLLKV